MRILFFLLISFPAIAQLPGSGSLSIKTAAGSGRSIAEEVDGNTTGNKSLTTLSNTAGFSTPHGMLEFYGYTQCSVAPNAVTDADANVVSDDVTITWTPDALGEAVKHFRVERTAQSDPGVWVFVINVAAGTGDTTTDNDLASDQYQWRVGAENDCGNSGSVNTNSVIVP